MNILIVSQYFYPESFRINDLAIALVKRGHQVTVLSGTPNYPRGNFFPGYSWFKRTRETLQGVQIIRVPLVPRLRGRGWQLALNYLSYAFFASVLGPFFIRGKVDAILVYQVSPVTMGIPAVVLKRLKRARLFFWVQDLWPETLAAMGAVRSPRILGMIGSLVDWIYRHSDFVLGQSEAFLPAIHARGISPEKTLYFPNSAETLYRPMDVPANSPIRAMMPEGFRVLFAGNIGIAQDFPNVLAAAELLRNESAIQWVIVGDGSVRSWLEEEIKKRGLEKNFSLLGQHPVEKMPEFFACADVLLATLKKDPIFEKVIPSKIQSYLASAKPIVAGMDGEGARIVEVAKSGWSCPAENPRALADCVLAGYRSTVIEREKMGVEGRRYFEEHFELNRLLDRFESWLPKR